MWDVAPWGGTAPLHAFAEHSRPRECFWLAVPISAFFFFAFIFLSCGTTFVGRVNLALWAPFCNILGIHMAREEEDRRRAVYCLRYSLEAAARRTLNA